VTAKWVIDCSFASALALPDKSSRRVETFFLEHAEAELWVPALWWYELANVLTVAERRQVLTRADVENAIVLYGHLMFRTDEAKGMEEVRRLSEVSRTYGLSAYDAAYLELALRQGAPLATLDRQLLEAAKKSGLGTWA
jgi:predicted nucleic acid-binding protein